jgi:hypothetical protein
VLHYAQQVGIERLAPHDLRRYAAWKTMPSPRPYALRLADFLFGHSA